ncbi:T-cell receptor alpha chain V region CTL-F3 [Takifugu flavidus]|nr:T-cell receptor alpha chain V region CTL-F3 [Takifugu flavidus]
MGPADPQFILSRFTFGKGTTEDEFKERFSSTLNPTMKSAPLKIQELQLSDSASVLLCSEAHSDRKQQKVRREEDKVMQPPEDVVAAEGDTVTLDFTFQTSDPSPTLFWYKQENNKFPKCFFGPSRKKASDPQRISALINKMSAPLKIQELQLSDSAVYYCALRPTVTGSSRSAH